MVRRRVITWTTAGTWLIGPQRTNIWEIFMKYNHIHPRKRFWKMSLLTPRIFYWKICCVLSYIRFLTTSSSNSILTHSSPWDPTWISISKLKSGINILSISRKIATRWMSQTLTENQSPLVQVMAWCHQATSHYLSQCWPWYVSSYSITKPQWVNRWN